eukprot:scaffold180474_cov13-Tisochrysis_lutea.AAC.1
MSDRLDAFPRWSSASQHADRKKRPAVLQLQRVRSWMPALTFAAGWVTSISRRMACPSLVSTMPVCPG